MRKLWIIELSESTSDKKIKNPTERYRVKIRNSMGRVVIGKGATPIIAYHFATRQLVVRPWLENPKEESETPTKKVQCVKTNGMIKSIRHTTGEIAITLLTGDAPQEIRIGDEVTISKIETDAIL